MVMRLAVSLGAGDSTGPAGQVRVAVEAERRGYAVAWAAEAYGADAATVLAYAAARTTHIALGAGVFQIPGRSAAMTAMTTATLDALSGGRFLLGLGVSGPQVSEGWHGVRFADPLGRTREYVDVVRRALARETLTYDGTHITLPLPDGPGKPLRLSLRPVRSDVPIYLAAVGPRNLELAGEIANGWLGIFTSPELVRDAVATIRRGRERTGRDASGFDVAPTVAASAGPDVAACADAVRPYTALYVGGMGSRTHNFYNAQAGRLGFTREAAAVQEAYLAGRPRDAAALLPMELLDATALLGPRERIAERLTAYAAAGVTTLTIAPQGATAEARLATLAEVAAAAGLAGVHLGPVDTAEGGPAWA